MGVGKSKARCGGWWTETRESANTRLGARQARSGWSRQPGQSTSCERRGEPCRSCAGNDESGAHEEDEEGEREQEKKPREDEIDKDDEEEVFGNLLGLGDDELVQQLLETYTNTRPS